MFKKLKTQPGKRNALKAQINFMNYVLDQNADMKHFRVSKYQRQTVTINQLKTNLLTMISMTTNNCENRGKNILLFVDSICLSI